MKNLREGCRRIALVMSFGLIALLFSGSDDIYTFFKSPSIEAFFKSLLMELLLWFVGAFIVNERRFEVDFGGILAWLAWSGFQRPISAS